MLPRLFDLLDGQSGREGLLQAINLIGLCNAQSVEIARASHLEFGGAGSLLDGHSLGIRAVCGDQKLLEIEDLFGHCGKRNYLTVFFFFDLVKQAEGTPPLGELHLIVHSFQRHSHNTAPRLV